MNSWLFLVSFKPCAFISVWYCILTVLQFINVKLIDFWQFYYRKNPENPPLAILIKKKLFQMYTRNVHSYIIPNRKCNLWYSFPSSTKRTYLLKLSNMHLCTQQKQQDIILKLNSKSYVIQMDTSIPMFACVFICNRINGKHFPLFVFSM